MNRHLVRMTAIAAAVTITTTVSGCTRSGNGTPVGPAATVAPVQVSADHPVGAELRYGTTVVPRPGIVYQPDVVFIGGGADAIRSVAGDGLAWTIDPNAPGAANLAVGKIMVATSHSVGRVASLTRDGANLRVVLVPVQLTDVYRDADISSASPIPVADVLSYETPSVSAADAGGSSAAPPSSGPSKLMQALPLPTPPQPGLPGNLPPGIAIPEAPQGDTFDSDGMTLQPSWTGKGAGLDMYYAQGNSFFHGNVTLHLARPTVTFHLVIGHSRLEEASIALHGEGSVSVSLNAVSRNTDGSFVKNIPIPATFVVPVGDFHLTVSQTLTISMQFVGACHFKTHGSYGLQGDLKFGYRNGFFADHVTGTIADPMTSHTEEEGVAGTAVEISWNPRLAIGIGLLVASASLWFEVRLKLGVAADTPLSLTASCVSDAVTISDRVGVGWEIHPIVQKIVNAFLSIFNVKPIPQRGEFASRLYPIFGPYKANNCPR